MLKKLFDGIHVVDSVMKNRVEEKLIQPCLHSLENRI